MSLRRRVGPVVEAFRENEILTYASAIAFQLLVAIVPLAALALLLIGLTGSEHLWHDGWKLTVAERVTGEAYLAIADSVARVFDRATPLVAALAAGFVVWEVSGSVRAVTAALNRIYGSRETRPAWHRFGLSVALALGGMVLVLTAFGLVAFGGALFWPAALLLLWLTTGMLIRLAPAERVEARWVSIGSVLVVAFWSGASVLYGLYVSRVADFETAFGFVTAALLLTGYMYASAIVFLAGAQLDQLLRLEARRGSKRRGRGGKG